MTDQGEVSEVDRLRPGGIEDMGDEAPPADLANQTADGAPKNYGELSPDAELPEADDVPVAVDEQPGRRTGNNDAEDLRRRESRMIWEGGPVD